MFVERVWRLVKCECIYLKAYESVSQVRSDIARYMDCYTAERGHCSHASDGRPQQNAYVELFNSAARYGWLSEFGWSDLAEMQDFATKSIWSCNRDRQG